MLEEFFFDLPLALNVVLVLISLFGVIIIAQRLGNEAQDT